MSKASHEVFDKLHAAVADTLLKALAGEDISPQMLSQAIKFLKDNGIDSPATSSRISGLDAALAEKLNSIDMDDFNTPPN